ILPSMVKLPEESVIDFTRRVQQTMASALNLSPTVYTSSDKKELIKRLQISTGD
ncbi:Transposon Tf2-9 polyprotein, partial [Araneus ventricosus]